MSVIVNLPRRPLKRFRPTAAGPSTAAHAYWRVRATVIQFHGNWSLDAIQFRGVIGGPDLAKGGTPLSSGDFAGRPVANAFDGDSTTIWSSSAGAPPMWIGYQFPAPVAINEVFLRCIGDGTFYDQAMTSGVVEYSDDGVSWTVAWTHTVMDNYTGLFEERVLQRPDPSIAMKKWRIRPTAIQAFSNWTCAELEFRATAGGASLCTGGTPISSSDFSGRPASNAFDGSGATIWSSNTGPPMYLGYALASPSVVAQIRILAMNDATFYQQSPTAFLLQCCSDVLGRAWVDAKTFSGVTWSGAAQSQLFAYP